MSEGEQKELFSFDTNQTALVRPEAISQDGSLLVIARTNELEVFNWMTRKTVAKWSLPARDPNLQRDANISADNKFVAMTDSDGLHLFEISTLHERILPTGDCDEVRFSPRGHWVAISLLWPDPSLPAVVRIWDSQTGNEVRSISFTTKWAFLAWSPDGKKLYAKIGFPGSLIVWDIESGTSKSSGVPGAVAEVVAVSPDGRDLVGADVRGELSVVGIESRRVLASSGFPPARTRAWFSADGRWFAAAAEQNGQIVVWEWPTWKTAGTFRGHRDFVWDICFLPHENRLISLGNDRTVRLWELGQTPNTLALTNNLVGPQDEPCTTQFSPSGNLVTLPTYTSTTNFETLLWDENERKVKAKLNGLAVQFSEDGQHLLVQTAAHRLQMRDVQSLQVGHEFVLESKTNVFPKLSADGRFLGYQSWSNRLSRYFRVYSAAGEVVYSSEEWVRPWAFSPDSRLLALNDSGPIDDNYSTLLLKELTEPAERRVPHCGARCLAFSPDGRLLAAGTFPPGVNLVDIATGTVIAKLRGHQTMVTAVAFSPDGKTLASGAQDQTIRLYNVETRREVAVFQVSSIVFSLAFSPDGQTLVSSEAASESEPGQYRFWYAPRIDAPPLPLPALRAPAPDSIWVTASKLEALQGTPARANAKP